MSILPVSCFIESDIVKVVCASIVAKSSWSDAFGLLEIGTRSVGSRWKPKWTASWQNYVNKTNLWLVFIQKRGKREYKADSRQHTQFHACQFGTLTDNVPQWQRQSNNLARQTII